VSAAPASDGRLSTFRHGVHPPERKGATDALAIERMPFVEEYVLPLSQHTGAPSKPVVRVGQRLRRGQLIGEPGGFVSTALHAPVTGRVAAIEPRLHPNGKTLPAIVVETDPYDSQRLPESAPVDPMSLTAAEMADRVQLAGLVGLGGAAFPSHVKFQVPEGKRVELVVVNGCECEPYLTCDHRIMVERPAAVVRGTEIIRDRVGARRATIGVEENKPDAIAALRAASADIEVVPLRVKYPQGAEKMLVDAIFHREIPEGGLPLDLEILVNNVGTTAALADLFDRGIPLIERVVTVTGPAVARPRNLLVPLGTPLRAAIEHCGPGPRHIRRLPGISLHPLRALRRRLPALPQSHSPRPAGAGRAAGRAGGPSPDELLRVRRLLLRLSVAHSAGPVDAFRQGPRAPEQGGSVSRGRVGDRGGTPRRGPRA
jgi:electron transport complex protein RnfC